MAEENEDVEVEGGGDERPEWLPSEFETPEALAKSYAESRRLIEERGREANDAIARADALEEQLAAQQQYQPQYNGQQQNPLVVDYSRAFEEGDIEGMLRVQAQIAQAVAQQSVPAALEQDFSMLTAFAENQVRQTDPDYDGYQEKVYEVLKQNPQLMPPGATLPVVEQGVRTALDVVRGREARDAQVSAQQKEQQQEAAHREKMNAQTVPGGGTRPASADESASAWDKIVAAKSGGRLQLP